VLNAARWYDAPTGRWLSEDPIEFSGGLTSLADYVGNDPVNKTDPSGLAESPIAYPPNIPGIENYRPSGQFVAGRTESFSSLGGPVAVGGVDPAQADRELQRMREAKAREIAFDVVRKRQEIARYDKDIDSLNARLRPLPPGVSGWCSAAQPHQRELDSNERESIQRQIQLLTDRKKEAEKQAGELHSAAWAKWHSAGFHAATPIVTGSRGGLEYSAPTTYWDLTDPKKFNFYFGMTPEASSFSYALEGFAWLVGMGPLMKAGKVAKAAGQVGGHADEAVVAGSKATQNVECVASANAGRLGTLTYEGNTAWRSAGGLRYGADPKFGNRVQHVLRHAADDATRAGSHGVFDAGRTGTLRAIDEAFGVAQRGGAGVTVAQQGSRTVYTIDMGRRIGYVGGQAGRAAGNPAARHIQLVVENGNEVITAFPIIP